MKILILYAKVGNGHLKAAEAIKEELEKRVGKEDVIYFEDGLKESSYIMNKLIIKGYAGLVKHMPDMYESIYNRTDTTKLSMIDEAYKIINKGLTIKLKKLLRKTNPDVILSTHPFVTRMCGYLKKKRKTEAKLLTLITDYGIHNMWVNEKEYIDKILLPNEDMVGDAIRNYDVPEDKLLVTGMPVSSSFKKNLVDEEIFSYFGLKNKRTFLFFAGGGLGLGESSKIFEDILKSEQDFQLIAVAGKNEKQKRKLEKIANNYSKDVLILGYTSKVPELMKIADIVITKPGGMTTTECLFMETPMLFINVIPGQEEENAAYFTNNGIAIRYDSKDDIEDILSVVINNKLRLKQMREMCSYLKKGDATEKIVEQIILNGGKN